MQVKKENHNNKKIVILCSHTPSLFWFRMDMMKHFQELGYDVIAIGNEEISKWKNKFEEYGIHYHEIYIQRNGINPFSDIKSFFSIWNILKKEKPDLIFTYQAKTVVYGSVAAKMLGVKEVYPLIAGIGSIFITDDIKTKVLRSIMVLEYKIAIKNCPKVFFQNKDDVDIFKKYKIIKDQQVVILHGSGVNLKKFKMQGFPKNMAFICISRLIRDKGVFEYLEACQEIRRMYPKVRCLLIGPFDSNPSALQEEELNHYIENGCVEYFGEQQDVIPYLGEASVFILPSYREGTPKTVLEAMACGRPIITTDAPGCRETVIQGKNGFLVPVKNVSAIVEKMKFFIENPGSMEQMGCEGRKLVEDLFDVVKVNESIANAMNL